MALLVFILLWLSPLTARELSLKEALETALQNNHLIKTAKRDVKAQELELNAVKTTLLPRIKFESGFTRTNIPSYVFMNKLNQERITSQDFDPQRLNDPSSVNNFESRLSLEVPLWLGGKVQSAIRMTEYEQKAVALEAERKREEVIKQAYQAYADAVLAKESIKVSRQVLEEARERIKLAEQMHKAGLALLSDLLRAQVYLSKAQENLEKSVRSYHIAKKGLELVVGLPLGEFEVGELSECPNIRLEELREEAVRRKDIRAMEERLKMLQEAYRYTLSESLPHVSALLQYAIYSKDHPFSFDGKGYSLGLSFSWGFDVGLSALKKAQANLERKAGLEERIKLMKDTAIFDIERAYSEYINAIDMMRSAEDRIKASKEVLRMIELRYKNGLARMVDLLDAQSELDKARFEKLQAINACHKSYVDLLFNAGRTEEVVR
ncbi:MAG: TolC family protein [Aquificaceae bacterium]|nr:TolC family protein [Aquificaceae bacterium]